MILMKMLHYGYLKASDGEKNFMQFGSRLKFLVTITKLIFG